jgi:hypothetical protein
MSFDVFFVSLEPPAPVAAVRAQIEEAVRSVGGQLRREGGAAPGDVVEAKGGSNFEWYGPNPARQNDKGGGMAALRGLNLSICQCLFAIAMRTDWVIVAAATHSRTVRAKGSRELPLYEGMPELLEVENPEELCRFLDGGYEAWKTYRDQIIKSPQ